MRKLRKIQRGFGLLELMLSMVIVALLLIMATRYYQSAHRAQRVSDAVSGINAIIGAANEYAIASGSYGSISDISTIDSLMPDSAHGDMNPWGIPYTAKGTASLLVPLSSVLVTATGGWEAVFWVASFLNGTAAILAWFVLRPMRRKLIERSASM